MRQDYAEVVARAWKDGRFRANLLRDPKATLAACGVSTPEGVEVEVVENTNNKIYFILPRNPAAVGELSHGVDDTIGFCNTCGTSTPCATY